MSKPIVYISSKMSGVPQNNYPEFDRVASELRERGYVVLSPHEIDPPDIREKAWSNLTGATPRSVWAKCISGDIAVIACGAVDAVVVFGDWQNSRGACAETYFAYRLLGMPVYHFGPSDPLREVASLQLDRAHLALHNPAHVGIAPN